MYDIMDWGRHVYMDGDMVPTRINTKKSKKKNQICTFMCGRYVQYGYSSSSVTPSARSDR